MPRLRINSHSFEISNLDKVIFPDDNIIKELLIGYYMKIANTMLPHVKDRPLTLYRYPDGISHEGFVQQEAPEYFPDWIKTVRMDKREGGTIEHIVCNNAATLAYLANQGVVTFHVWPSTIDKPEYPDRMIFDLDPPDDSFELVRLAAHSFHEILTELNVPSHIMTTGSRGMHVVVPLDRTSNFDLVRVKAREIAALVAGRYPDKLTSEIRKEKREGRLFIDIARNSFGQTAVAPYSLRARPGAPVATPLSWNEISIKSLNSQKYTFSNIFDRIETVGDPWHDIAREGISLDKIKLEKISGKVT